MPDFRIRVAGDDLSFAAGHFITLADGSCECLHGHSYRVAVELRGPLDDCGCVVDFLAVRGALQAILAELDHRTLLPEQHTTIAVSNTGNDVEARHGDRRWSFPKADCVVLPLANTTTELLADYIGRRLVEALRAGELQSRVKQEDRHSCLSKTASLTRKMTDRNVCPPDFAGLLALRATGLTPIRLRVEIAEGSGCSAATPWMWVDRGTGHA